MKVSKKILLLLLTLALCTGAVHGQYLVWEVYVNGDDVNAIAEDDFSVWIGTEGGLLSLDKLGGETEFFKKSDSDLPAIRVTAIAVDSYGDKWIGTDGGGLARFTGTTWQIFDTGNSGIASDRITAIAIDSSQTKWIGTVDGGLVSFHGSTWTIYNALNSDLPDNHVTSIAIDSDNRKWIGTETSGVVFFDDVDWINWNTANSGLPDNDIRSVAVRGVTDIWVGTGSRGLVHYNGLAWNVYDQSNSSLPNNTVTGVAVDAGNNLWIATQNGLAFYNNVNWFIYNTVSSALTDNRIETIFIGDDGKKWVGTRSGAAMYDDVGWALYETSDTPLPDNDLKSIAVGSDDKKWIATAFDGLASFDGSDWTIFNTTNSGLPSDNLRTVTVDFGNNIWVGTDYDGVSYFDGLFWNVYNSANSGLPDNSVNVICLDASNRKWIGTAFGGLSVFDGANWTVYNFSNSGLPDNGIRSLAVDIDGRKWIGTSYGGLAVLDGRDWTVYNPTNSGLPDVTVNAVAIDIDDTRWIGTGLGGVAHFDGTNWLVYNTGNSDLPSNVINGIVIDKNGTKWISTGKGLVSFDGKTWTVYDADNSELPSDDVRSTALDSDGNRWIATGHGAAFFGDRSSSFLPQITLSTHMINFGTVTLGDSAEQILTITNSGNVDVDILTSYITGLDPDDYEIKSGGGIHTIPPASTLDMTLIFLPVTGGSKIARLVVTSTAVTSPDTVDLNGYAVAPSISYSPSSINFGNVRVGVDITRPLAITNTGTARLEIEKIGITGPGKDYFRVDTTSFSLAPLESRTLIVGFLPDQPVDYSAFLTVQSNTGTDNLPLSGKGIAPLLGLSSGEIDFGEVRANTSAMLQLTVTNEGSAQLNIVSIDVTGPNAENFTLDQTPFTLNAGNSKVLNVLFSPDAIGTFSATIAITSDGGDRNVFLLGTGAEPALLVQPSILDFRSVAMGESAVDSLRIENVGRLDLQVGPITLTGSDAVSFAVDTSSFLLGPDETRTLAVVFTPQRAGSITSTLRFQSSGGGVNISLTGIGIAPELTVRTPVLDFGSVGLFATEKRRLAMINTGTATLNIEPLTISGPDADRFTFSRSPITLAPGDSHRVEISFLPDSLGDYSANIGITSDGGNVAVALTGRGIAAALEVLPAVLEFVSVGIGSAGRDSIAVSNIGSADLIVQPPRIIGVDAARFTVSADAFALSPGETRYLPVQFAPVRGGGHSATLMVESNAGSKSITLSGTGTLPVTVLSVSGLEFGSLPLLADSNRVVRLTNSSPAVLTVSAVEVSGLHAAEFTVTPHETIADVPPFGTIDFTVRFSPSQKGERTALLVITSNAVGSPDSLSLSGKGIDLSLKLTDIEPGAGSELPVFIPIPEDYTPTLGRLYYRLTGQSEYQVGNMAVSDTALSASIPADFITLRGVEYYVYVSDGRHEGFYPEINPIAAPATIRVYVERYTPPLELQKMVYKMISLPLVPVETSVSALFFDDFGDYNKQMWRINRYNPSTASYAEFPALQNGLTAGNGFWLISRKTVNFDIDESWSTPAAGSFALRLEPGWSQIGDPFAFPVQWSDVGGSSLVENPVSYDGMDYRYDTRVIQPWEGYFIHNPQDTAVTLSIPPVESTEGLGKSGPAVLSEREYLLQLRASVPETKLVDSWNYIGLLEDALTGADKKDFFEAPPIGDFVQLSIVDNGDRFAGNFKSPHSEGNRWEMEVRTSLPAKVDVEIQVSEVGQLGDSMKFYILDRDYGRLLISDVRGFTVHIDEKYPLRHLSVLIGTETYARKYSEGIPLVPLSFALDQNYPNPFNPETTIVYRLPALSFVELEIYNILGRRIRSLVSRREDAGEKSVVWDGRDDFGRIVAGGVYITRLRAGDFAATRKMVLVR